MTAQPWRLTADSCSVRVRSDRPPTALGMGDCCALDSGKRHSIFRWIRGGRVADREVARSAPTPGFGSWVQAVLIAETSNSRVILSLTKTPPVSSAAFQVMP